MCGVDRDGENDRKRHRDETALRICVLHYFVFILFFLFFSYQIHPRMHAHTHTHPPAVIETVFLIETKGLRFLCNSFDPYQWCVFHMLWNPHLHHLPHPTDPIYFPSPSHLTLLRTRTECSVNKPTFTSCIYNDTDTAAVSLFASCKTPVPLSLSLGWSVSTQFASLTVTIQCGTDLNWRI